jgi:NurA-like 5'-3' nuclease
MKWDSKERIFKLHLEGKSIREIGTITGHPKSTVDRTLKNGEYELYKQSLALTVPNRDKLNDLEEAKALIQKYHEVSQKWVKQLLTALDDGVITEESFVMGVKALESLAKAKQIEAQNIQEIIKARAYIVKAKESGLD